MEIFPGERMDVEGVVLGEPDQLEPDRPQVFDSGVALFRVHVGVEETVQGRSFA